MISCDITGCSCHFYGARSACDVGEKCTTDLYETEKSHEVVAVVHPWLLAWLGIAGTNSLKVLEKFGAAETHSAALHVAHECDDLLIGRWWQLPLQAAEHEL